MISNLISNPRKVFLIDGFGAIVSAFSLGILLVQFETMFGMPKEKLYYLAIAAVIFATYSLSCYFFFSNKNWQRYLTIIAISNFIYSLITFSLIIRLSHKLIIWGFIYFLLEIIILLILIWIEYKTIRMSKG